MKSLDEFSTEELVSELKRIEDNPNTSEVRKELTNDLYFRQYLAAKERENPSLRRVLKDNSDAERIYQFGVSFTTNQPTFLIRPPRYSLAPCVAFIWNGEE